MRAIVVLYVWARMKQGEVASFVMNVVKMMTGNATFPDPTVKLDDLNKAAINYAETFGNRLNGKNARAEFKEAKAVVFDMLKQEAIYINAAVSTVTDPIVRDTLITSAGMVSTKASKSKKITPAQPQSPEVQYKNGDLIISTNTVKSASSYLWVVFLGELFDINITSQQLELSPSAKYIMMPVGKSRECIRNVGVGADVHVQVLAQNTAGKSMFSPVVSFHTGG